MEYNEEDFLMLSGVQHFAFCRRQWALIHIDQLWDDNLRTAEGDILHERCHDEYSSECRKEVIISRSMPVFSRTLGASGECDVVEFRRSAEGINLNGRDGLYTVYPVEYKHGEPKDDDIDTVQLAAQAMCLEEMLGCEIKSGAVYYGMTKRRLKVEITDGLREKVRDMFAQMHDYYSRGYIPRVKTSKSCNACSLKNLCMPTLMKIKSARLYLEENLGSVSNSDDNI